MRAFMGNGRSDRDGYVKTPEEKRWEMLQQIIAADAADKPIRISSNRILFGIKSHAEEVIERAAEEETQRCLEKLREGRANCSGVSTKTRKDRRALKS